MAAMKATLFIFCVCCMLGVATLGSPASDGANSSWKAKWIWLKQGNYNPYNQTVLARKTFKLA